MNFFGHVVVAAWVRAEAGFALGAMVPDLVGMARARLRGTRRGAVANGVDWHHRTDAAFHTAPSFTALLAAGRSELTAAGVARGPAWAAAHVAIELALDGALVGDPAAAALYPAALADDGAAGDLVWEEAADARRFAALRARMAARGLPHAYRDAAALADILVHVLAPRSRLALDEAAAGAAAAWLPGFRARVEEAAPALPGELRARLL